MGTELSKQVRVKKWAVGLDECTTLTLDESGKFYTCTFSNNENSDGYYITETKISMPVHVVKSYIACGDMEETNPVLDFINEKIAEYKATIKQAQEDYNDGLLQTCVKVELETVNYNMIKVLTKVKELLENE